jgi:flavorubredoxin
MRDLLLIYATKSGNTRLIAEAIAEGARKMELDAGAFSLCDISRDEIMDARAIAIGSPTYEHSLLLPVEKLLDSMEWDKCCGKLGVAFGSYGWSGEAPVLIAGKMRELGFDVLDPVLRVPYTPDEKDTDACILLAKGIAKYLKDLKRHPEKTACT